MKPHIVPLSQWRRRIIFGILFLTFLFSLPVYMFYATGYRYDLFSDAPLITVTGGMYISAEAVESQIFINDQEVTNARVFRKASYIQGLEPGIHRVHVQAPGLHTWVKDLSVFRHIVTEVEAFNIPLVPQIRAVTPYQTNANVAVFVVASSTNHQLFSTASNTSPFVATTSIATSTYKQNPEYALLSDLFLAKASSSQGRQEQKAAFSFSTTSTTSATTNEMATTTIVKNNLALFQYDKDVYVEARGVGKKIPHYFCTNQIEIEDTLALTKVKNLLTEEGKPFYANTLNELSNNTRECRKIIKIDRMGQTVHDFAFVPNNEDLILMQLDNGIYITEVDDRAWQNSQLLYGGTNLMFVIYSDGIFIKDEDLLMEIFTEIVPVG